MEVVEKLEKPNVYIHLSPNDVAESLLDRGESLSMKGKLYGSMRVFQQAAKLYSEICSFLDVKDWEVEDQAERKIIDKMRDAAFLKRKYCLSRIGEEARKVGNGR